MVVTVPKRNHCLPKVSIMIPTFGQEHLILDAVDSALAQDYSNLEVIVADDASPDRTAEVVASRSDSRLRYHRNKVNLGRVGNYRNTLYHLATGDWIVNLDGDDYYTDPRFISAAIASIVQDPEIVIVAARRKSESGGPIHYGDDITVKGLQVIRNIYDPAYHFAHLATIYNRRAAIRADFYRFNVISSDWESLYRLAATGKVRFLNRLVGVWRRSAENASRTATISNWIDNLTIWKSIFDAATAAGLDRRDANTLRRKMERDFAYFGYSRVAEMNNAKLLVEYILACRTVIGWTGFFRLVFNWKVLVKLLRNIR
jgi:glycosyltransferase involved in cell wall biosynthesis